MLQFPLIKKRVLSDDEEVDQPLRRKMGRPFDYTPPDEIVNSRFKPDIKMEVIDTPPVDFKYDSRSKVNFGSGEKKSLFVKLNKKQPTKIFKLNVQEEKVKKENNALQQKIAEIEKNQRATEKSKDDYLREIEQLREQVNLNPKSNELAAKLEHEQKKFREVQNKLNELREQSKIEADKAKKELQEKMNALRNEKIALEKSMSEKEREFEAKIEDIRNTPVSRKEQLELEKLALEIENQKIKHFKQMEELKKANPVKVKTEPGTETKTNANTKKPTNINLINDLKTKYDPIILPSNIASDPINITNQFLTDHGYKIAGTAAGLYLSYKIYKYLNFFGQAKKKKKVVA